MHDPDFDPYLPPRAPVGYAQSKLGETEVLLGNPWVTIWTQPRATIRGIVDTDPIQGVILLSILSGFSSFAGNISQVPTIGILPKLIITVISGTIFGLLGLYINSALMCWVGHWLGGAATHQETRAAQAWSSVPTVPVAVMGIVLILISDKPPELLALTGLVQVILGIWYLVLYVKCMAEVHRFSAWTSLGAVILSGILALGIFAVVFGLGFVLYSNFRAGF